MRRSSRIGMSTWVVGRSDWVTRMPQAWRTWTCATALLLGCGTAPGVDAASGLVDASADAGVPDTSTTDASDPIDAADPVDTADPIDAGDPSDASDTDAASSDASDTSVPRPSCAPLPVDGLVEITQLTSIAGTTLTFGGGFHVRRVGDAQPSAICLATVADEVGACRLVGGCASAAFCGDVGALTATQGAVRYEALPTPLLPGAYYTTSTVPRVAAGTVFTITASGSAEIAPFSTDLSMPSVVAPSLPSSIDRSVDLPINWPAVSADVILFALTASDGSTAIVCEAPGDAEVLVVASSLLSHFAAGSAVIQASSANVRDEVGSGGATRIRVVDRAVVQSVSVL